MRNISIFKIIIYLALTCLISSVSLMASSHREAPLISSDPLADNVDLYAFRSPDNPDMITIIATYVPMQLPHGGPNYYSFGENIRYEIHVDNDANIAGDEITYRFTFNSINEDPTTFFNIRLGAQNLKTTYTLERSLDGGVSFQTILTNGVVPPNNIGPRSIESAVGLGTSYATLFQDAISSTTTGETVFVGPTDDPFFVDLGGIFDLGDAPRQFGKPVDGLACLNVSAIAIQVPISTLLKAGAPATPTNILDSDYVIGVWASASRPAVTTLTSTDNPTYSGDWVQVSRLGMPLTNEAVIPVGQKDFWNSITPYDEISETTLDEYFYNPELALYMDDDQFGPAVPAFASLRIQENSLGGFDFTNGADGLFGLKGNPALAGTALDDNIFGTLLLPDSGKPRSVDLWPIFHTGVPNLAPYHLATGKNGNPLANGKPFINNFLPNGGDMLRLNMAVPPTPRDDANFSSLGLVQAAAIGLTVEPFNMSTDLEFIPNMDGFPNGRRLEDDVTRIELQAVSGVVLAAVGLWYDDFDPMSSTSPVTDDLLNVLTFTTGVEANDESFSNSFPYLAMPHSGTGDCSGEIYNEEPEDDIASDGNFYVSSNNQNRIGVFGISEKDELNFTTFVNQAVDADGIYYDEQNDVLFQLNRSNNTIDLYSDVKTNIELGTSPTYVMSSSSDFSNGREIAVSGDKLVVAQDAIDGNGQVNKFSVYTISPTSIEFDRDLISDINLWGIHLDGNTLYAIEDNSANLARYDNFFSNAPGMVSATETIIIEGMVRTHGLTYNSDLDLMVLTDVGAASSPTDGAFTVIEDYSTSAGDQSISLAEQIRIEGPNSLLGNPVDIAYNQDLDLIYITERANGGGKVLVFENPMASGDQTPQYSEDFAGASGIHFPGGDTDYMLQSVGDLFVSSNTTGNVGAIEIIEDRRLSLDSFMSAGIDADGIYYDEEADVLYQLNRSDNVLNAFSMVEENLALGQEPNLTATSTSDFINGREITVAGNRMLVAQDANDANGQQNALYEYTFSPTGFELKDVYEVSINLWGIQADINTLYAIVDNSSQLAIFENVFENLSGTVDPTTIVEIENMVRTHGLTYDSDQDMMILTDVGAASSPDDGAIVVIRNFTAAIDDDLVSASEQIRIEGPMTELGNPVDVAYFALLDAVYVAERANEGGKILAFVNPQSNGDIAPSYVQSFPGASAIYLSGFTREGNPTTGIFEAPEKSEFVSVYPNPSSDFIDYNIEDLNANRDVTIQIYNTAGIVVSETKTESSQSRIDVRNLKSGAYFIKIETESKSYKSKFYKF